MRSPSVILQQVETLAAGANLARSLQSQFGSDKTSETSTLRRISAKKNANKKRPASQNPLLNDR
jgi:hypothetical protein